jgi:hypothetical protein
LKEGKSSKEVGNKARAIQEALDRTIPPIYLTFNNAVIKLNQLVVNLLRNDTQMDR